MVHPECVFQGATPASCLKLPSCTVVTQRPRQWNVSHLPSPACSADL